MRSRSGCILHKRCGETFTIRSKDPRRLVKNGRLPGVECKRVDAPRLTPSMGVALEDLKLEQIAVVYPGKKRYPPGKRTAAVPLEAVKDGMKGLFPKKERP